MGSNNFKQFDPNKNNIMSDTDYENSEYRKGGAVEGIAPSISHNKLFYQVSTMCAAIGQSLANKGYIASDADLTALIALFTATVGINADWDAISGVAQILNKPELRLVPVGAIFQWPVETIPTGYLECNGSSKLIVNYPDLFAIIGNTYGAVDPTHFNVPDYRGYFLRGWDHGVGRDADRLTRTDRGDGVVGDRAGTKEGFALQEHTHLIRYGAYNGSGYGGLSANTTLSPQPSYGVNGAIVSPETRPLNINVMFIIKF